jgi:dolichol-phosphate mannosyltransferase
MSDRYLLQATILLVCLRLLSAFLVDLSPQEAYYWAYAQHPALSYFDHPPVVAWVISAGQFVLGKTELGVRIGGFLLTLLSTWLLYALGKLWFSRRAGLWAALLFQLLPLYFVYGVLITPDVPLTFFWLLTLYLVSIAVRKGEKWAWYAAGMALGLCMLSKYTAVFLVFSTFLLLLLDRCYRPWLTRKEPYLALLIAALFFTPVIFWNFEHNWASFSAASENLCWYSSESLLLLCWQAY